MTRTQIQETIFDMIKNHMPVDLTDVYLFNLIRAPDGLSASC